MSIHDELIAEVADLANDIEDACAVDDAPVIGASLDDVAMLRRVIAALRKAAQDSERIDWIERNPDRAEPVEGNGSWAVWRNEEGEHEPVIYPTLRAAIDAARAQECECGHWRSQHHIAAGLLRMCEVCSCTHFRPLRTADMGAAPPGSAAAAKTADFPTNMPMPAMSPVTPPAPPADAAHDERETYALEVLCRVFDDGADVAYAEWCEWYKPSEWLHPSRALGAFIRQRLDAG